VKDWRFWLAEQRGTLTAVAIFIVMFTIYCSNHPAGFTPNVVQTAANKGVLLAFVAMAQSLVVMTAGIDLSVGMVFTLTNCLASALVFGSPAQVAFGVVAALLCGLLCGSINGLIVIYGRLQPIVTTIATSAVYFGVALWIRPTPGGKVDEDLSDALTG
jgi:ribose transport system permease protein